MMKKINLSLGILIIMFLTSCSVDEELSAPILKNEKKSIGFKSVMINQENGMLSFENEKSMFDAINYFSKMESEERISWGRENNFKSQQIIMDELNLAQEAFEKTIFKDIPEDIEIEDMLQLGYQPQLCSQIENGIEDGILLKIIEEDGSLSYQLKVKNGSQYVINREGKVMINGEVFNYSEKNGVAKSSWVLVYSDEKGNIFGDFPSVIWYYNSSNERFLHSYGTALYEKIVSGERFIQHWFYTRSVAHKKSWGVWKIRSSYKPIKALTGTWDWTVCDVLNEGLIIDKPDFSLEEAPSGFYYDFDHHNDAFVLLNPSGNCLEPVSTYDRVEFIDANIKGVFWGGPSGYTTNYSFGY